MSGSSQEDLAPHNSSGGTCSLLAAQGMASVLETPLLMGTVMGSMVQDWGGPTLAGKPEITDSLAYPMWDYSACKSPIYLLREGQIHIPSVDTWTAKERELRLFAPPNALDAALPAKLLWLLGRTPGG